MDFVVLVSVSMSLFSGLRGLRGQKRLQFKTIVDLDLLILDARDDRLLEEEYDVDLFWLQLNYHLVLVVSEENFC